MRPLPRTPDALTPHAARFRPYVCSLDGASRLRARGAAAVRPHLVTAPFARPAPAPVEVGASSAGALMVVWWHPGEGSWGRDRSAAVEVAVARAGVERHVDVVEV